MFESGFRSQTLVLLVGACAAALLSVAPARAASIFLDPATVSPLPGESFSLDLVISDLVGGDAGTVGGFDVSIAFDATSVSLLDVQFGALLGALPGEAFYDTILATGSLQIAGLSLLSPAALDALQPGSFRLATLVFSATAARASAISIPSALIADALGRSIPLTLRGGSAIAPIPEPGAALLFAAGLAIVASASRRPSR